MRHHSAVNIFRFIEHDGQSELTAGMCSAYATKHESRSTTDAFIFMIAWVASLSGVRFRWHTSRRSG